MVKFAGICGKNYIKFASVLFFIVAVTLISCPMFDKPLTNDTFVPVSDITIAHTVMLQGTYLPLDSTVIPENASNKAIEWSVSSGKASFYGENGLFADEDGLVELVATIDKGLGARRGDFIKKFTITVNSSFVAAAEINDVPATAFVGVPLLLTGIVEPENAVNQTITWSIESGHAEIEDDILIATGAGTVTVLAVIVNGVAWGEDLIREFVITVIQPVTDIVDVPVKAFVGVPLPLTGTVEPDDASCKEIIWQVKDGPAAINGNNELNAAAAGTVVVIATIADGLAPGKDFIGEFNITVIKAVADIVDVPAAVLVNIPFTLTGTIVPPGITDESIKWEMKSGPAYISNGNILNAVNDGLVTIIARIPNGLAAGEEYVKEFTITVIRPVLGISGVPDRAVVGAPLSLTALIEPANASNLVIEWAIKDSENTGAVLFDNNIINASAGGTLIITAVIKNGRFLGEDFTEEFSITVIQPVLNISGVPTSMTTAAPLVLNPVLMPRNASYRDIEWLVKAGEASFDGASLSASVGGVVIVTAKIANGRALGEDYTQDFSIGVTEPVTDIIDVPDHATLGLPISLGGTVEPDDASFQEIIWSVKIGSAIINGDILTAATGTTVTITATIGNGLADGEDFTKDFVITLIRPVTDIRSVPSTAAVGTPLVLNGTILPNNASNRSIIWNIESDGATGAALDGNVLNFTAKGIVLVSATIVNGLTHETNFTKSFIIAVLQPVTEIIDVPAWTAVGTPLNLSGTVIPSNADHTAILWSVKNGPASISNGNELHTTDGGTVTVTATVINGRAMGTDFTADFIITAILPVTDIINVPAAAIAGIPLTLYAAVEPNVATHQTVVWTVENAEINGASISDGNILHTVNGGILNVIATIANGLAMGEDFIRDFSIEVIQPVTDINNIPSAMTTSAPVLLSSAQISPANASKQTVEWTVIDSGNTGAVISGDNLSANDDGTITLSAKIINGKAVGENFTKTFTITVIRPVSNISGVSATAYVGTGLPLTGIVTPVNATNRTIRWSVTSGPANITNGNRLNVTAPGTVTVTATIANGLTIGEDFTKEFTVTAKQPVSDINDVPDWAVVGEPLALTAAILPDNATYQTIMWSVKDGPAAISNDNELNATAGGMVTVIAAIEHGRAQGVDFVEEFTITAIQPVTDISAIPTAAVVGTPLYLTANVLPPNASNKTIVWSISEGSSIANITNGNRLNVTADGTVKVTATIANGKAHGEDFIKEFSPITVIKPVTDISGAPAWAAVGTPLTLNATVEPNDATNRSIIWSVANGPANITGGNILNATGAGLLTITAKIINGSALGTKFVEEFTITAIQPVDNITGVPEWAIVDIPLTLTAIVAPPNASNKTIEWRVKTGSANISNGNQLNAEAGGTVIVTATIVNGKAYGINHTQDFDIEVIQPVTDITGVPAWAVVGESFDLASTVSVVPDNASKQAIVWSVASDPLILDGSIITPSAGGAITITATITDGRAHESDFIKEFIITVIKPVTGITLVPDVWAVVGTPLTLTATVSPTDASNKAIVWTVASGPASIANGNQFIATAGGDVTVTATIANGKSQGVPFTKDFTIKAIQPVTDITGVPAWAVAGTELGFTPTILPGNASNQTILWSITNNGGDTEAAINTETGALNTAKGGTVIITATITHGKAHNVNFIKDFIITVIQPVEEITGVPQYAVVGTPLTLNSTIIPADASNKTIVWSVTEGESLASISGNTFTAIAGGMVTVIATIADGEAHGTDYTQDFEIEVIQPVTDITDVQEWAVVGTPLTFNATIEPDEASNKTIVWSVTEGESLASISGNTFTAIAGGAITITATITDGLKHGTDFTKEFTITAIQPVTNITGVQEWAVVGTPLILSSSITPSNASNQTIVWSVTSGPASISNRNQLNISAAEKITVTATISNGKAQGIPFTKNFEIEVIQPVTNIIDLPVWALVDEPLALAGTVLPANASNQTIEWSVLNAGTTNAVINGNELSASNKGMVTVTATINNGKAYEIPFTQNFDIELIQPVTGIINMPETAYVGTILSLTGIVDPVNASSQTIVWSISSDTNNAFITNGNELNTSSRGSVTVTATISDGWGMNNDAVYNFDIEIIQPVTDITDGPTAAVAGVSLPLAATIVPDDASITEIVWDITDDGGDSNATIDHETNTLSTTKGGTIKVTATIANGKAIDEDFVEEFEITVIKKVTGITSVPPAVFIGTMLELTGNVQPPDASNTVINWSISSGAGIASIANGYELNATAKGIVTVTATIVNGEAIGENFTDSFTINVIQPVTDITDGPTAAVTGVSLPLTATIVPPNANNQTIKWSIANNGGDLGASVSGSTLTAAKGGTIIVTAEVESNNAEGDAFSKDFSIIVIKPVTGIDNVPAAAFAGTMLELTGNVQPTDASNTVIMWSISSGAGIASIANGNELNTSARGTVIVTATISNGKAIGENFTDSFTINVKQPVTDITDGPTAAVAGVSLPLTAIIVPSNANNQTILWSIKDNGGDSGAAIDDETFTLTATAGGIIKVTAKVENNNADGDAFTKDFNITVIQPVTGITDVPITAYIGTPLLLTGIIEPGNASNQTIVWSVGEGYTIAYIDNGNELNVIAKGTVTVIATIADGWAVGEDAVYNVNINVIQPVTDIINVPTATIEGIPLLLSGTVIPGNANYKEIIWEITDPGDTEAELGNNNILTAASAGLVELSATIINAKANGNFIKTFNIIIDERFYDVEEITDLPDTGYVRTALLLTGIVEPEEATNQSIQWSVKSGDAEIINDNELYASAAGVVTITATVVNGLSLDNVGIEDYTQDFDITVNNVPVFGITNIPDSAVVGTPVVLNGIVIPSNATYNEIVWSISSGSSIASLSNGNILNATAGGIVTLTAAIEKGLYDSTENGTEEKDFTDTFEITFSIIPVTDISGMSTDMTVNNPLTLSAVITPHNATYQTIVWEIVNAGTTNAEITGNILSADEGGMVLVRARVANGIDEGEDFTKCFMVTVIFPVSGIDDVPLWASVGTPLILTGTVLPENASYYLIEWSVTGGSASISNGNELNAAMKGTVTVKATIENGNSMGNNYTQDFDIEVIQPVSNISGVPAWAVADEELTLSGIVAPSNASYQTIEWSVKSGDATIINDNELKATVGGTVIVTAKIIDGKGNNINYTQDFTITVIQPVTDITGMPAWAAAGTPLVLTGTVVEPESATYQTIVWNVKSGPASISGNTLTATAGGTVTVTATIVNGSAQGSDFIKDYSITVIQPVTNITAVPAWAVAGTPLTLSGTVAPVNATNKIIVWSVKSGPASISGNQLTATAGGPITVTATITNGSAYDTNYTKDFTITAIQPVTGISLVPAAWAVVGSPLTLAGTVEPASASNTTILWSVASGPATISGGNQLNATAGGIVTITATIINGKAQGTNYTQNFAITVIRPVTGISNVPEWGAVGTPLTLTGTVSPSSTTYKAINWSIETYGGTGANLDGTILNFTSAGTMSVTATITDGWAHGSDAVYYFDIEVIQPVTGIDDVPEWATVGESIDLNGTVIPANATYDEIEWSLTSGPATLIGNILTVNVGGTVIITATVVNGRAQGSDFIEDHIITVIQPVEGITNVPAWAAVGTPLVLTGTVAPSNASNKTIVWSVASDPTSITNGNQFTAKAGGEVTVTATITNGEAFGANYTQNFTITAIQPVTNITDVPKWAVVDEELTLSGIVAPSNATYNSIEWSVKSGPAAITDENKFKATAGGTVIVTAAITDGNAKDNDYTQDFAITVIQPVTGIDDVPDTAYVGTPLQLTGTVEPVNASYKSIVWSVEDSPELIENGILYATESGAVTVTATIINGLAHDISYTQDFTITIIQPVTDITEVPTAAVAGTPLTLSGTVQPTNVISTAIVWSITSAGTTGAALSSNVLTTTAGGIVTVTATIIGGNVNGNDYTQDFAITVIKPVMNISGVPAVAYVGTALTLTGTVLPPDASNKVITWSVKSGPATISGSSNNRLNATAEGSVTVTATIANGSAQGINYTQDFVINTIQPVTDITGVPTAAIAGTPLTLTGTIKPSNVSYTLIVWSINSAGTTGATLDYTGTILSTAAGGTVTVTATIIGGNVNGNDYTQDFAITVIQKVTNITDVPDTVYVGTALTLTGTVTPADASNKTIVWSTENELASITGINNNRLNVTGKGTEAQVTVTAKIINGLAVGTDYTQDFDIEVIQPVTDITNGPPGALVNDSLLLTATIEPDNANNQTIVWSMKDDGDTGALISGDTLNTSAGGTVIVTASVANNTAQGDAFTKDFIIRVIEPVTDIDNVPDTAYVGTILSLTGTVVPVNATNKIITWSTENELATITGVNRNRLNATTRGDVIVTATIIDGEAVGTDFSKDFTINVIQPITDIVNGPDAAVVGDPLTLSAEIVPHDANFQEIEWSIKDPGGTGATINDDILTATAGGTVIVTATIENGTAMEVDYVWDFAITVIQPVTGISNNMPLAAVVGTPLTLTGTVAPANASNRIIVWSVKNGPAIISGNQLNATAGGGNVTVTATIIDGSAVGVNYTQDFTITAIQPVTNIINVPASAAVGTPLMLSGTVQPGNASNTSIQWEMKSGEATITNGNELNASIRGTVTVTATIINGNAVDSNYMQDFNINVIQPVTGLSDVAQYAYVGTPLTLNALVTPSNANYQTIVWSISDPGTTGATLNGNVLSATAGGIVTVNASIANGRAMGVPYTEDFIIYALVPPGINLSIDHFTLIDEGSGFFNDVPPIILSKSEADIRTISANSIPVIAWHVGNINLGAEDSITLRAGSFNIGAYTLSLTFSKDGKPWLAKIPFTVTE